MRLGLSPRRKLQAQTETTWKGGVTMPAKVFIVDRQYNADYRVCFVDREYRQKNHQIIAGGKLVDREYNADCKVFIVDHEYQAQILITHANFPK